MHIEYNRLGTDMVMGMIYIPGALNILLLPTKEGHGLLLVLSEDSIDLRRTIYPLRQSSESRCSSRSGRRVYYNQRSFRTPV